jgi:hypothetical protein
MLHGPIGLLHHDAVVLAQPPSRYGQSPGAALRLLLHAGDHTAPSGVERACADDPLHAQPETAIGGGGSVDASALRTQARLRGTPSQQRVPIGAVPRQAGALIAPHDPHLSQRHLGQKRLRAIAPLGALGRAAQVGLDDLDALIGPAEVVGMLPHGVLELWALGVGEPLGPGGLTQVHHGFAPEMMGLDHGCG